MKLATKKYWRRYSTELWRNVASSTNIKREIPIRVQNNPYGLYESPKTYDEDGVAYNDGTWVVYNTCRVTSGRLRKKIHCKDKKELIRHICGYIIFLYHCGVAKYEARIYVVRYIIFKLTFDEGMFDCNWDNKKLLDDKILSIYNNDVEKYDCHRQDERRYAIDPKLLKGKSKSEQTKLHNEIEGKMTKRILKENYNPQLSIRKNVENLKKKGIKISKSTIGRWLQEQSQQEEKRATLMTLFLE